VLNDEGLRYRDELVRHKILDAIGDLYLLGHSLIGEYKAYKSGHALNNKLLLLCLSIRTLGNMLFMKMQHKQHQSPMLSRLLLVRNN